MSGGSWDYFYCKLLDVSERLGESSCPWRRAFGAHLEDAANVLKTIEWVDSADRSKPQDELAIKAFLGAHGKEKAYTILMNDARKLITQLEELVSE